MGLESHPLTALLVGVLSAAGNGKAIVALRACLTTGALLAMQRVFVREGKSGIFRIIVQIIRTLPGVNQLLSLALKNEVKGAMKTLVNRKSAGETQNQPVICIPEQGISKETLLLQVSKDKTLDGTYCHDGKAFALVYYNEEGRFADHVKLNAKMFEAFNIGSKNIVDNEIFREFMHGNALNPIMFPTLRRYETEAISMASWMLHGDSNVVGAMTSGGTESILMAIHAFREMARDQRPHILRPEIIAPITIHPAHEKAGHYFDVKIIHCGVDPVTKQANVDELEALISENTIGIALSAPQYCHCVVDPIEQVGALAQKYGLPLHVDACYGGFILPWIEKLGYAVSPFDFRVPGVTSISADIHKYGFAPKGASFILFRSEQVRKYMYYAYSEWPGGLYISPSMAGTRPGANIAMAWATLKSMGQDGYLNEARKIMDTTQEMKDGIRAIDGLELVVDTVMSGFAIQSTNPNVHIFSVADEMEKLGWKMERQSNPDSLHCSIMPNHANKNVGKQFVQELQVSYSKVLEQGTNLKDGTAAIYGMVGSIPDKTIVDEFLKGFFSEMYKVSPP